MKTFDILLANPHTIVMFFFIKYVPCFFYTGSLPDFMSIVLVMRFAFSVLYLVRLSSQGTQKLSKSSACVFNLLILILKIAFFSTTHFLQTLCMYAFSHNSQWLNLAIDMVSVVGELFRGQTFKSLDSILISASCKLRKIFTLKDQPPDTTDDDGKLRACSHRSESRSVSCFGSQSAS